MSKVILSLICLSTLIGALPSIASEEGVLPFGTFRIESLGIGESGPVVVSGNQSNQGVLKFSVDVFEKHFDLNAAQLQQLQQLQQLGGYINGIQLSYEAGYKQLGGRTIYILLARGFTSGVASRKYVTITESGTIKVGEKP